MSYLSNKQKQENKQRFINQCDAAISFWTKKGNIENIEYFKKLKSKTL